MKAVTPIALLLAISLIATIEWARYQTRERTSCYRQAATASQCAGPNAVERGIRWLVGIN